MFLMRKCGATLMMKEFAQEATSDSEPLLQPAAANKPKHAWPELVGTPGGSTVAAIERERPDLLSVSSMADDSVMTMDHREDRVRVLVDAAGNVARPPQCGYLLARPLY